jgi:hypothetical protein
MYRNFAAKYTIGKLIPGSIEWGENRECVCLRSLWLYSGAMLEKGS